MVQMVVLERVPNPKVVEAGLRFYTSVLAGSGASICLGFVYEVRDCDYKQNAPSNLNRKQIVL